MICFNNTVFKRSTLLIIILLLVLPIQIFAASPEPAWGKKGIVSTAHPLATQAAIEVLEDGGNAIDAALAAIYTLDVVTHYSMGIGGGEFWVVHWAKTGETITIDGRECAPLAATRDMYLVPDDTTGAVMPMASTVGPLAGGVPGSIAAREYALQKYGTKARKQVMASAIDAADNGFLISPRQEEIFAGTAPYFQMFETSSKVMFKNDSTTWQTGDRFYQKDLAKTLKRIAKSGNQDFYHGETANQIAGYLAEMGGMITLEDLANYEAIVREPVKGTYRDYEIFSMPPPSSGGIHLIQMLNMLEEWNLGQFGRYSSRYYHHLGEVMEAAFADRAEYLGDPAFVNVPTEGLISKDYAAELRYYIEDTWQRRVRGPGNPMMYMDNPPDSLLKPSHTSHLSIIDKWGNVVSLTSSVNTHFGSKMIVGNTGMFLNNTMDDFSLRPGYPNAYGLVGKEANAIAPTKRPLSSMTPTILLKDGKPFMAVGAAGGPKIITATLQTILNVIDFGADIQEAISDPRIHNQWMPNYLFMDSEISPDCAKELFRLGHKIARYPLGSAVHGVMVDPETGIMYGGFEPRATGSAAGVN
jgi:gamma-glutamyltranspeptidase / glutathione hydrolase